MVDIANEIQQQVRERKPLTPTVMLKNRWFLYGVSLMFFFLVWDSAARMFASGLPRPHDGVVAVAETQMPGAKDVVVLPVSHSGMLVSRRVAGAVGCFLRSGHFPRADDND